MRRNWALARDPRSGSRIARKQLRARIRAAYAAAFGKGWRENVPRPALEQVQRRQVMGLIHGQSISWGFWRGPTPVLPPM